MRKRDGSKVSIQKARKDIGEVSFNGIYIGVVDEPKLVEDFEFKLDGKVEETVDVFKSTGVDFEQRDYEIFWKPKREYLEDGKFTGSKVDFGKVLFHRPLTVKRVW